MRNYSFTLPLFNVAIFFFFFFWKCYIGLFLILSFCLSFFFFLFLPKYVTVSFFSFYFSFLPSILRMHLRYVGMKILCVLLKICGSHNTVHRLPNSEKCKFLGKFGSHSTIHTFKNYFFCCVFSNKFSVLSK